MRLHRLAALLLALSTSAGQAFDEFALSCRVHLPDGERTYLLHVGAPMLELYSWSTSPRIRLVGTHGVALNVRQYSSDRILVAAPEPLRGDPGTVTLDIDRHTASVTATYRGPEQRTPRGRVWKIEAEAQGACQRTTQGF